MTKKLFIILGVCSILLAGCGTKTTETNNGDVASKETKITTLSYENKENRLKLGFPSSRTFKENVYGATVMFFAPKKSDTTENLGITIKLIQSGTDLNSLYNENKEVLKGISQDFKIESEKDIEVDNFPAKKIEYVFSQGEYKIKQQQIILIKGENLYMINYTATQDNFDKNEKDVNEIINSINIRG